MTSRSEHKHAMRPLALLVLAALSMSAWGCGGAGGGGDPATAAGHHPNASQPATRPVRDYDRFGDNTYDADDDHVRYYGHAASAADRRAIAKLVERYYAAAAARDGARACSLMVSSLPGQIVEQYGRSPGPPELHGGTCGVVMSKLFRENPREYRLESGTLRVTGARVSGDEAYALVAWRGMAIGSMFVRRQHGVWRAGLWLAGPLA